MKRLLLAIGLLLSSCAPAHAQSLIDGSQIDRFWSSNEHGDLGLRITSSSTSDLGLAATGQLIIGGHVFLHDLVSCSSIQSSALGLLSCGSSNNFGTGNVLAIGARYLASSTGSLQNLFDTRYLSFQNIAVSGQSTVVADAYNDTLTLTAGTNMSITTNASTDTITLNATDTNTTYTAGQGLTLNGTTFRTNSTLSGSLVRFTTVSGSTVFAKNALISSGTLVVNNGVTLKGTPNCGSLQTISGAVSCGAIFGTGNVLAIGDARYLASSTGSLRTLFDSRYLSFQTIAVSGQSNVVTDLYNDTLTLVAGSNMTITTDATTDTITLASSATGGSGNFGTGNVLTVGDSRYVKKQGDTMTGALAILKKSGTNTGNTLVVDTKGLVYNASNKQVGIGTGTTTQTLTLQTLTGSTAIAFLENYSNTAAFSGNGGTLFPGTAANDATFGASAWTAPNNIKVEDGTTTSTIGTGSGVITQYLEGTNFGFTIPTNATILGITVEWKRSASNNLTNNIRDVRSRLVKGGVIGTTDKADTVSKWPLTLQYATYGNAIDLWGTTWTPADINASTFGAVLAAETYCGGACSTSPSVDAVRITVTYTAPASSQKRTWTMGPDANNLGRFELAQAGALGSRVVLTATETGSMGFGLGNTSPGSKFSFSGAMIIGGNVGSSAADAGVIAEFIGTASGRVLRAQDRLASSGVLVVMSGAFLQGKTRISQGTALAPSLAFLNAPTTGIDNNINGSLEVTVGGTPAAQFFANQTLFKAGTAASPGLAWSDSASTGMFEPQLNALGFATAGVSRASLTGTGLLLVNGEYVGSGVVIARAKNSVLLNLVDTTNKNAVSLLTGTGSPENVVRASLGSQFWDARGREYIKSDSGSAVNGWFPVPMMRVIVKTADETRTSDNALKSDGQMFVDARGNETVAIDADIIWEANAAPDIQFSLNGPAGSFCTFSVLYDSSAFQSNAHTGCNVGEGIAALGTGNRQSAHVKGTVRLGTTPGRASLSWAQLASSVGATTVDSGSYTIFYRGLQQ